MSLDDNTISLIDRIRTSDPVRKVHSKAKNVSGFYPSKKMGLTIQFESRTLELAAIYTMEFNNDVVEYYDQPSTFKIVYQHKGKRRGHLYTPDFFVIENDWIGWEEWKTEEEMSKLILKYPGRYMIDENGVWRCPPAEDYSNNYGLSFRIRTSKEINWTLQRNLRFLEDYLIAENIVVEDQKINLIKTLIGRKPGTTIEELISLDNIYDADDLYTLLATNEVYGDIENNLITDFSDFPIFSSNEVAIAYVNLTKSEKKDEFNPSAFKMYPGQQMNWEGIFVLF